MIGVDEAGKGAVVGSMFVAAVAGDPDDLPDGIRDSKRLTPDERERLASLVRDGYEVSVVEIPPGEIDSYVSDGGMNDLMVEAHSRALEDIDADLTADEPILDASDVDADRFGRRVADRLGADETDVDAEHGADEAHPIVSAASVVAKVERDSHVAGLDAGSGYPGDPEAVEFLREQAPDYPDCVRLSWSTARRIAEKEPQSAFNDFDLG